MHSYRNPVVPGFYPDPSVVKVGGTYFLANSSFQFFPGIPIHASIDLVNWKIIGNAICRPEQLDLNEALTRVVDKDAKRVYSTGLYAPTIRYHDGKFYVICTVVLPDPVLHESGRLLSFYRNFIVATDDIYGGKWSDPVYFDFYGIDPDLFFDDDGKVYVTAARTHIFYKTIQQAEIDVKTGTLLTPFTDIWQGHSKILTEGPHIYKKDGYYYLLVAEGGTSTGHMISMARSICISGPYETCEQNPLLTASGTSNYIQCVGHGDLVEGLNPGEWWATVLAIREAKDSYPLGRETHLIPVKWPENEFPSFVLPTPIMEVDCEIGIQNTPEARTLNLNDADLLYLRTPELSSYRQDGPSIYLKPGNHPLDTGVDSTTFVAKRQTDLVCEFSARLIVSQHECNLEAGITVYKDTFRHLTMFWSAALNQVCFGVRTLKYPKFEILNRSAKILNANFIDFCCKADQSSYTFSYRTVEDAKWTELGKYGAEAVSGYDFTGAVLGIYVTGEGEEVEFRNVVFA
ncbi:beta-xylosidase [Lipomyces arxii]|uniref:beta-xylosidase n=1 Tax=Lipomyces arxii TaxID=56418 RepID=UPI0034CEECE4